MQILNHFHLAGLAAEVVALESNDTSRTDIEARLAAFGLRNVHVEAGALWEGATARAPFDVILVNGSIQTNPTTLTDQLTPNGCLLVIKHDPQDPTGRAGKAMRFDRHSAGIGARYLFDAAAPCLAGFEQPAHFVF